MKVILKLLVLSPLLTLDLFAQLYEPPRFPNEYQQANNSELFANITDFFDHDRRTFSKFNQDLRGDVKSIIKLRGSSNDLYEISGDSSDMFWSTDEYNFDEKKKLKRRCTVMSSCGQVGDSYVLISSSAQIEFFKDFSKNTCDSIYWLKNDTLSFIQRFNYNTLGICVSHNRYNLKNGQEIKFDEIINKVIENGNITEIHSKFTVEKYKNDLLIQLEFQQDGNHSKDSSVAYIQYDDNQHFRKYVRVNPQGDTLEFLVFNAIGSITKESNLEYDGCLSKTVYSYDSLGRKELESRIDLCPDGYNSEQMNKFIYTNGEIEERWLSNGSITTKIYYKLDEYGNILSVKTDSFNYLYTYVYDTHGNWVEMKKIENGKLAKVNYRKIKYW